MEITFRQISRSHVKTVQGLVTASSHPDVIPVGAQVEFDEFSGDRRGETTPVLRVEENEHAVLGEALVDAQHDGTYITVQVA